MFCGENEISHIVRVGKMQGIAIIFGAGGFLGRYICQQFLRQGNKVVGVGRTPPEAEELSRFIAGDILNMNLNSIFQELQPRWVINAAGGASVGKSFANPYEDWRQTVEVQAKILEAIRLCDSKPFYIFLSSAAVYGEPGYLPIRESAPCRPISPYGMHKWQAELLQEEYTQFYKIQGAILRIFSAFGEGLHKQVVYELCQKILQSDNQLEVYGTGEETRDFIHASDVAQAVYCVAEKKATGIINVASGEQTRIADLARMLVEQLRPNFPIKFTGEGKNGNPHRWQADVRLLKLLHLQEGRPLYAYLREYVAWFLEMH